MAWPSGIGANHERVVTGVLVTAIAAANQKNAVTEGIW